MFWFHGKAWLAGDISAGKKFRDRIGNEKGKALHNITGMLQWGKAFRTETSQEEIYYMLNKIFMPTGTSLGTFDSGMATIVEHSSEDEASLFLLAIYEGEDLQWPFKIITQQATPQPIAYCGDGPVDDSRGWQTYHDKCF